MFHKWLLQINQFIFFSESNDEIIIDESEPENDENDVDMISESEKEPSIDQLKITLDESSLLSVDEISQPSIIYQNENENISSNISSNTISFVKNFQADICDSDLLRGYFFYTVYFE